MDENPITEEAGWQLQVPEDGPGVGMPRKLAQPRQKLNRKAQPNTAAPFWSIVYMRAGCGRSASPVRRGASGLCPLAYSTNFRDLAATAGSVPTSSSVDRADVAVL